MSIQSALRGLFAIPSKIKKFLNNPNVEKKAAELASQVQSLLEYGTAAVQMISALAPNRTADEINTVLKTVGLVARVDSSTPSETIRGLLLQAASAMLAGNLKVAFDRAGAAGIQVGLQKLTSANQLPDHVLDTVVQVAFSLTKPTVPALTGTSISA